MQYRQHRTHVALNTPLQLADTNNRLTALESELKRLRPLLMVQPSFLSDPEVLQHASLVDFTPPDNRHDRSKTRRHSDHPKEKDDTPAPASKAPARANADAEHTVPESTPEAPPPASTTGEIGVRPQDLTLAPGQMQHVSSSQQQPDSMPDAQASTSMPPPALKPSTSRHSADKKKLKEKRTRFRAPGPRTPLLSDARAECVLTAARRIGRVRAGIAAGLVRDRTRERQEAEVQTPAEGEPGPSNYAAAAYPNTGSPQSVRVGHQPQPQPHPYAMPGFVYMQAVPSPPGGGGRAVPAQVPQGAMVVPVWPMQGAGRQQAQTLNQQLQPSPGRGRGLGRGRGQGSLDSLLTAATAARTMMVGQESGAGAGEDTEKEEEDEEEEVEERQVPVRVAKRPQRRKSGAVSAPKRRKTGASVSVSASTSGAASTTRGGGAGRTRRPTKKVLEAQDQAQDRKGKGKQREVPAAAPVPTKGKVNGASVHTRPANAVPPPVPVPQPVPVARVRSALDVLADQAAQEQERMPASGPGSRRQSAEPARGARLGPSGLVRTQTVETVLEEEEEPEDPGPEEEEGVSTEDAEGSVEAGVAEEEAPLGAGSAKSSRALRIEVGQGTSPPVHAGA